MQHHRSSPSSRNARSCFELLRALSQNLHAFPLATPVAAASPARASPVRVRTVQCRAIAAPAKEAHAPAQGPIILNGQVLHSSTAKQLEIVRDLGSSGYLQKQVRAGQRQQQQRASRPHVLVLTHSRMFPQVLPLLKTGTQAWQPSDFLPASNDPDFEDKVRQRHGRVWAGVRGPELPALQLWCLS